MHWLYTLIRLEAVIILSELATWLGGLIRIMGLSLCNPEFPSPAGRFLLLTTKVGNRTLLSKKILSFFLDAANLECHPCSLILWTQIARIDRIKARAKKSVLSASVFVYLNTDCTDWSDYKWYPLTSKAEKQIALLIPRSGREGWKEVDLVGFVHCYLMLIIFF